MKTILTLIIAMLCVAVCQAAPAESKKEKKDHMTIPDVPSDTGPWGTKKKYDERERIIWVRIKKDSDFDEVFARLRKTDIYMKSKLVVIALEKSNGGGYWGTIVKDAYDAKNQGKRIESKEFNGRTLKIGGTWLVTNVEGILIKVQIAKKENGSAF